MQPWAVASFGAAILIAAHYLFLRAASGRLGDTLGALALELSAAIGIFFYFLITPRDSVPTTRLGVVFAVLSGFCISGGSILLFYALRRGGPVAATGTIVLGGGVTISALLAPWIFAEGFSARRAIGIALGMAAMAVLALDAPRPEP